MRIVLIVGFFLMVVAQWYAPLSMMFRQNQIRAEGQEFKFKTLPVDPADPFRGKYVTLSFEDDWVTVEDTLQVFEPDEELYGILAIDSSGFAYVETLLRDKPDISNYIKVRVQYTWKGKYTSSRNNRIGNKLQLDFPFNRLYVEETKASDAEKLYRENNLADTTSVCYGLVRVHDGEASLVDVIINDRPILDIIREMNRD